MGIDGEMKDAIITQEKAPLIKKEERETDPHTIQAAKEAAQVGFIDTLKETVDEKIRNLDPHVQKAVELEVNTGKAAAVVGFESIPGFYLIAKLLKNTKLGKNFFPIQWENDPKLWKDTPGVFRFAADALSLVGLGAARIVPLAWQGLHNTIESKIELVKAVTDRRKVDSEITRLVRPSSEAQQAAQLFRPKMQLKAV